MSERKLDDNLKSLEIVSVPLSNFIVGMGHTPIPTVEEYRSMFRYEIGDNMVMVACPVKQTRTASGIELPANEGNQNYAKDFNAGVVILKTGKILTEDTMLSKLRPNSIIKIKGQGDEITDGVVNVYHHDIANLKGKTDTSEKEVFLNPDYMNRYAAKEGGYKYQVWIIPIWSIYAYVGEVNVVQQDLTNEA